jgi:hypothetical protein
MESDIPDMQAILRRIEILEKENTRLKRLPLTVLLFGLGGLVLMGATNGTPTVLSARKFVLVDSQGRARLEIATPASLGTPAVGLRPDDPGIWISDEKGNDRAIIVSDGLSFQDDLGEKRLDMGVNPSGEPTIRLSDAQRRLRLAMTVLAGGLPAVSLYGVGTSPRMDIAVDRSGLPGIDFVGPNEKPRMTIGIIPSGEPHIHLLDSQGFRMVLGTTNTVTPATGATQRTSAASLVMFSKDNKVLWSAP